MMLAGNVSASPLPVRHHHTHRRAAEADQGPDGEIDTSGDHHERHARSHQCQRGNAVRHGAKRRHTEEAVAQQTEEQNHRRKYDGEDEVIGEAAEHFLKRNRERLTLRNLNHQFK
jgi:hypothetical protein